MSNKIKIKKKKNDTDKAKERERIMNVISNNFKNIAEVRDLIDVNKTGKVKIRKGFGFEEVDRGSYAHLNYIHKLELEMGRKMSVDLVDMFK